jgi:uncharacterized protein (TIGR02246 family)
VGVTIAHERSVDVSSGDRAAVSALYEALITGWNSKNGEAFAAPIAQDGAVTGFDGSEQRGRDQIEQEMQRIFGDHETATYVAKVKSVELLSSDVALLRAIAAMILPGESDLEPERNAQQTVVAVNEGGEWRIVLFQNTPARYDGRPELVEQFTQELREAGLT